MNATSSVAVIVVAAGSGSRFGATLPKQFCELAGAPVLITTLRRMAKAMPSARLIVVLSSDMIPMWKEMCHQAGFQSPEIVEGGETRWHSVRNALNALSNDVEFVMVHDGARPLVSGEVCSRLMDALQQGRHGALPVMPMADSLRQINDQGSEAVDRSLYRAVQTPQAFSASLLLRAYQLPWRPEFTDDASVMEAAGFSDLALVEGAPETLKITLSHDLAIVETFMARSDC